MTSFHTDGVSHPKTSQTTGFPPDAPKGAEAVLKSGSTKRVPTMRRMQRPAEAGGVDFTVQRAPVPEGAFKGKSDQVSGPDVNALLMWPDPKTPSGGYAIVAEYTRTVDLFGLRGLSKLWNSVMPERLRMTLDLPRVSLYYVQSQGEGEYSLSPLNGKAGSFDNPRETKPVGTLQLGGDGIKGATLTHPHGSGIETIEFDGSAVGSRLEPYVPGRYFDSSRPASGLDYVGSEANVTFGDDKIARYVEPESGTLMKFDIHEPIPGLMRMTLQGSGLELTPQQRAFKKDIESRAWFTLDIVCWKATDNRANQKDADKGMTTNEAIGVNLNDPSDVRFLYERHDRPTDLGTALRHGFVEPGISEAITQKHLPAAVRS